MWATYNLKSLSLTMDKHDLGIVEAFVGANTVPLYSVCNCSANMPPKSHSNEIGPYIGCSFSCQVPFATSLF